MLSQITTVTGEARALSKACTSKQIFGRFVASVNESKSWKHGCFSRCPPLPRSEIRLDWHIQLRTVRDDAVVCHEVAEC